MDRQILNITANEQILTVGEPIRISTNKVNYIEVHFTLGDNWSGYDSVRAVWFNDFYCISTVLDSNGVAFVPPEVMKRNGFVKVNLVGSISENDVLTDRLTSYPIVAVIVDCTAQINGAETAPVTPSQFEQFVSIVQDAVANIKDIVSTTLNADYTLTFVYSDGTSYTTPSIRGERGPRGADGADGTDGNGIASAVLNSNYTLTLTFTDGTSYTTPSIRGAQGPKGDPGDVSQAQLDAAVSDLKSEFNNFVGEGNSLFFDKSYNVIGSGNYVQKTVFELYDFSQGDTFTFTASSVSGATASSSLFWVTIKDNNGTNIRQLSNRSLQRITVSASDISSGAYKIVFSVYPAQGTALPESGATFANLIIVKGQEFNFIYSENFDNHVEELIAPSQPYLQDILDADIKFAKTTFAVSASKNNDGTSTYIYKDIDINITSCDVLGLSCENVQNNTVNKPFQIYQYDSNNASITGASYTLAQVQNGLVINPVSSAVKIKVRLYCSTTGGLTTTECIFTNIKIFISKDGNLRVDVKNAPNEHIVPAYYLKDNYLQGKVASILSVQETALANYDCFIFCTDQHWRLNARKSPALIKYLSEQLNIPRMFMGGDYDDGINMEAYQDFKDAYNGRIYNVIGNHEYMDQYKMVGGSYTSRTITGSTIWACINGGLYDAVLGDPERNYYYVDNTVEKMRYVILNVFTDSSVEEFSQAQQNWFENVALNLPDGYTCVIFSHLVAKPNHSTGILTLTTTGETIANIADSYQGNGKIACIINGHTHYDGLGTTTGGIPIFVTTCDKYIPYEGDDEWLSDTRFADTITEQAFDVFVIDKTNEIVSAIRIGCPADNPTGSPLEVRQANY